MRHGKARRLIPVLRDAALPELLELDLYVHIAGCSRCARQLRDMESAEGLLRRIPASILPIEASGQSAARLVSLARWSPDPYAPSPERWRFPALGLAGALCTVLLIATAGSWVPVRRDTPQQNLLAALQLEHSAYLPAGWNGSRF